MKLRYYMGVLLILTNVTAFAHAKEYDKQVIIAGYAENPLLLNQTFCFGYLKHPRQYKEKIMGILKPILQDGASTKKLVHDYVYIKYLRQRAEEASVIHRLDINADFVVTREEYDYVNSLARRKYLSQVDADSDYQNFIEEKDFNDDKQVTLDDVLKSYTLTDFLKTYRGAVEAQYLELLDYDPNHDDIITKEEWEFLLQKAFDSVDVNNDGQIAPDEKDYVCKYTHNVEKPLPF